MLEERLPEIGGKSDVGRVPARRHEDAADAREIVPGVERVPAAAETDAYAKAVVQADFEEAGDEDVIRKLLGDLTSAGCTVDEPRIRAMLNEKSIEARRQLLEAK